MGGFAVGNPGLFALCRCVTRHVDDVWLSGDPDLFII